MDPEEVVHSEDEEELSDTETLSDTEALSERGATIMHALSRKWDDIIIIVEFNGKGKPIGQKVCNKLSGWEGALARALIPLSAFQTWKKAPEELLNLLWVGILSDCIPSILTQDANMDSKVKAMINLIEEDADSFARRAEMYYKKRPDLMKPVKSSTELIVLLAKRYDHTTGALRRPSDHGVSVSQPSSLCIASMIHHPPESTEEPHTPEMTHPVMRASFDPDDF
ncbi:hypothetical protein IFM89_011179 [Coptis chinensis]|uniref:NAB domain-containing protein n=1 Tax=Coptis chinensis TaxID=261450 RepID=A0A835LU21_9MAGN|nr:hypothetical protein IFM89_011179 [Coptis chinensis]